MGRGVNPKKLAEWRRRVERRKKSGLTVAAFCRRERVSVSLWKYWQRQVESLSLGEGAQRGARPTPASFQPVEIIPRRNVVVRFPGGVTLEIPDDRIELVRLAIDRVASQPEAASC